MGSYNILIHKNSSLSFNRTYHLVKYATSPRLTCNLFTSSNFKLQNSGNNPQDLSKENFDVVVIGGGPAGYISSIKAAQLGLKSICIESRPTLGGTCLNVGCIPSKALLNISHKYHEACTQFKNFGILFNDCKLDFPTFMANKSKVVKSLIQGIDYLFKKNNVTRLQGHGSLKSPNSVEVTLSNQDKVLIQAKNIILATGSEPSSFSDKILPFDGNVVVSSTEALSLAKVPQKMIVVGGGIIGLELGSVYARLGTSVEIIEAGNRICSSMDGEAISCLMKSLSKLDIKFNLSMKVTGADIRENSATVHAESVDGKTKKSFETDLVLVSIGRKPYTTNLNLEGLGIEKDARGRIIVDDEYRVLNHPSIRAIGDIIKGPMLAHKAEEEAIVVSELIANVPTGQINTDAIPSVIYTYPEVAGVGYTEEMLKSKNIKYKRGFFPFGANSRAKTNQETEGFVKILSDSETDKILGGWIIGPYAGELISEIVLGIEYGACSEDIGRTCHAHPTLSEAVKEACMSSYSSPIHFA